jgi:hypothetical protein
MSYQRPKVSVTMDGAAFADFHRCKSVQDLFFALGMLGIVATKGSTTLQWTKFIEFMGRMRERKPQA